ncbi:MAG: ABC transporter ATP-binding protein [Clostridia bacterium]|nr:ABC transporter ATP-binding protein [Clostridia bacterium]
MKKYNKIVAKELNRILPYHLLGVVLHSVVIYMAFKIPNIIGNILDMLMQETINKSQIISQAYLLIFYSSFVFIPRTLYRILYFTVSRASDTYLRKQVVKHLQKVKPEYFEKENKGAFLAYLSKEIVSIDKALGNFWFWLTKMFVTPIMGIILIWGELNKELAIYLIPAFPIAIITMYIYYKKLKEKIEISRKQYVQLSRNIEQNTEGFLLVKSYNRQNEQIEEFKQINDKIYKADYEIGVAKNKISSVINFLWAYCYVAGFGIGIIYILNDAVSVGGIVAFIGYIGQILGDFVSAIQSFLTKMPYFAQAINRFNYFLNLEELNKEGKQLEKIDKIEIKHLFYWYDNSESLSLKDINMTIRKGEKIGIIGEVGSGKTTLMNILCGFYEIPNEMIYINDEDINTYQRNTIFEKYNYGIQSNIILDDTIKANIDIKEDLKNDELETIIQNAELKEDIEKMENRENTFVGEKGIKLSGGQKQRISIARNLGKIRDINIFDDTLSALDTKTEKKIMNQLIKEVGNNTLIVVSNKISSVKQLDKIYILLDGEIQDYGTHEELVQKNEFYKELDYLERKEETDEIYSKEKC